MTLSEVWVVAEHRNGLPTETTLECVAAARGLGETVVAVSYGERGAELAAVLGAHGVERLFNIGEIGDRLVAPRVAASISALAREHGPEAIFLSTSYDGRDIAA